MTGARGVMNAVDRLKQDHVGLRARLNNLEEMLPVEPANRVACRTNDRLFLRRHAVHLRRKERVIISCRGALAALVPDELARAEHEHRYELQLFCRVGRLLLYSLSFREDMPDGWPQRGFFFIHQSSERRRRPAEAGTQFLARLRRPPLAKDCLTGFERFPGGC